MSILKKLGVLAAVLSLVLLLAACGGKKGGEDSPEDYVVPGVSVAADSDEDLTGTPTYASDESPENLS
ncbi:MAG: hypothetical protein II437_04895 [Oscillospiraceae bacterium]|nr:hypothetical protein [Oscillospiraceae bacterium]